MNNPFRPPDSENLTIVVKIVQVVDYHASQVFWSFRDANDNYAVGVEDAL